MRSALLEDAMTDLIKSSNQEPFHNPWSRYDSPAVSRKYGREYLERLFVNMEKTTFAPEPDLQCEADLASARSLVPDGSTLVVFNENASIADCAKHLHKLTETICEKSQLSVEILSS